MLKIQNYAEIELGSEKYEPIDPDAWNYEIDPDYYEEIDLDIVNYEMSEIPHKKKILQKHVRNISNLSLQLKYCRNICVKYCKIFHRNIRILTFWNIFKNQWIFNSFRNILEIS